MPGLFHAVGLGPGDPQLLTLKARDRIEKADVLAWPVSPDGSSRAKAIIADWIRPHHIALPCPLPVGKSHRRAQYAAIADTLLPHYQENRQIVFTCEGDPLFYASFAALLPHLTERAITVSVVPGISAFHAAGAALAMPIAWGNAIFNVIPATLDDPTIRAALDHGRGGAIIKTGRHCGRLRRLLISSGRLDDAWYLSNIGCPGEVICPLADIKDTTAPYFSLILVRPRSAP